MESSNCFATCESVLFVNVLNIFCNKGKVEFRMRSPSSKAKPVKNKTEAKNV